MKVKIITRTIFLNVPDSEVAYPKTIQEVKYVNINGSWKTKKAEWDEYIAPNIQGKTPQIKVVPSKKVSPESRNEQICIDYQNIKQEQSQVLAEEIVKEDSVKSSNDEKEKSLSLFHNKKIRPISKSKKLFEIGVASLDHNGCHTWMYER